MLQYKENRDEDDNDRPSNTLDNFLELEQVLQMIDTIKSADNIAFENDYEKYKSILDRYQEQPHLLDPHLDVLLQHLLSKIRNRSQNENVKHAAFKYLYVICKVRTYKAFVKFLPHDLSDLNFILDLLEKQKPEEFNNWETRYVLLLWLSIVVMNPFHLVRLDPQTIDDTNSAKTKIERINTICQTYTSSSNTCSNIAAFLAAKFYIRNDIKNIYLNEFLDYVINQNNANSIDCKFGQLMAVAAILKHGKREDLLPYAEKLLRWIMSTHYKDSTDFLKYKCYTKIIQRIGLVYLKPHIANWRYKRGTRSLAMSLTREPTDVEDPNKKSSIMNEQNDKEEDVTVPDALEDIIEELLQALRSGGNDIRWSSAKGLGRVANRLCKELADDIIGSITEMLNPLEPHEAWHGACLALAEMAKRGLLLPNRLSDLVPLLMQALFYDEIKGYMSVGQHIRDSACYMCWAFARAYKPMDLQPFIHLIATGLVTVAVFDREINCRRAASAAFQESVGRLGNFPHGIEICSITDFYSVGIRQNSYLNISDKVAQFEEYCIPLIKHLIERKVNHWDITIRELTAKALHKLTRRNPDYMTKTVMKQLFLKTDSVDINTRHGSVLALGEITLSLKEFERERIKENNNDHLLEDEIIKSLNDLISKFFERDLYRGMSGEMMKQCSNEFIKNCSLANIPVTLQCLEIWQIIIDKSLINKSQAIRETAAQALGQVCLAYYCNTPKRIASNEAMVKNYINGADKSVEECTRMGYVKALGVLPANIIKPQFDNIFECLLRHSIIPNQTAAEGELNAKSKRNWCESRRDCVKSLISLVKTIGFEKSAQVSFANKEYLNKTLDYLLVASNEYTLDNRGDIGAWVREAAMSGLYELLNDCPKELLTPNYVQQIMLVFLQQSVEKIDRTRALAGRLFCKLVHLSPEIPHIPHHERLKATFPADADSILWLFADHTFPLFCSLLDLTEYSPHILLGLSASIGQLTESLIKHSSEAFIQFLRKNPTEVNRLCKEIVAIFDEYLLNERVTYPLLNFLEIILKSGYITSALLDTTTSFASDIYRLVNAEIKGYKKLYKLTSAIGVICQLIQVPHLCKKALMKSSVFLGLTHVHIRKTTATKLYEVLALYGDMCDINENCLDEALNILSETDWTLPLSEVRPIRNNLCNLLDIKPPSSVIG